MIESKTSFKSSHKFTKELEKDLAYTFRSTGSCPKEVTVRADVFAVMKREVGALGSPLALYLPLQNTEPYLYVDPLIMRSSHHQVIVRPEDQ